MLFGEIYKKKHTHTRQPQCGQTDSVKHNAGRWLNSDIIFESFFLILIGIGVFFLLLFHPKRYLPFDRLIFDSSSMRNKYSFWLHTWAAARPIFSRFHAPDYFSLTVTDYATVCILNSVFFLQYFLIFTQCHIQLSLISERCFFFCDSCWTLPVFLIHFLFYF